MNLSHSIFRAIALIAGLIATETGVRCVLAVPVTLQNPTATVEQSGYEVTKTLADDGGGWATNSAPSVAVFEAATPITWPNNLYTFELNSTSTIGGHVLGKFRLSVTTDAGPLSAAGAHNWIQLTPITATAINSNPVTVHPDNVIEAFDTDANTDVITVTAELLSYSAITGFRLEAISDLQGNYPGPGIPGNNNFVLDYFAVDATQLALPPVPEPASGGLLFAGLLGMACLRRKTPNLSRRPID